MLAGLAMWIRVPSSDKSVVAEIHQIADGDLYRAA